MTSELDLRKRAVGLLRSYQSEKRVTRAKSDLEALFERAAGSAEAELTNLRQAGTPAVGSGVRIESTVEEIWRELHAAYVQHLERLRQLRASDKRGLTREVDSMNERFTADVTRIGHTIDKLERPDYRSAALDRAAHDEPACRSPIFRGQAGPASSLAALIRGFVTGQL